MQISLVIGSTVRDETICDRKLLIVRKADAAGNMTGDALVAVDAVIVGIIDSLELGGELTYRKK